MIYTVEYMKPIFELLERCKGVSQSDEHHPEGDVFIHSLQVVHFAFRETKDTDLILAALLHDIGKYEKSKGHEQIACQWLEPYVSTKTLWLVEHHMRIWYYILGDMKRLGKCKYLIDHPWLPELVQLARWDKMGRNPNVIPKYDKDGIIERLDDCSVGHFRGNNASASC